MPSLAAPALPPGTMADREQPEIHANDLRLRLWQPGDREAVTTAYADPAIQRWHARSMTDDEASTWIANWPRRWSAETGAGWAVVDGDKMAGQISLRLIDLQDGRAEVSYWVLPHARGRRTASRALQALTEWSFGTLGLHRIEVLHSTANEPSCRVATAAGYGLEGTKRSEAKHADGWHDMHLHARIVGDR
ncbi:GNAT family N-acetyltransferase [Kutzneria sp. CA-103260]|uniref:GNAT family N-acetyltransferase n=1 Tax=Kutzneria sp. CA-103260 TaxID=2802641 RepID=UPI002012D96E|nr:GNAT family N-acetyltransferase [Kutzneria sp. CA-103260]